MLILGLLAGLAGPVPAQQVLAADAPPVFSTTPETAWVGIGIGAFLPVAGSPKPVGQDPAYRYIPNGTPGQQPTQRISDIGNPNLKQWAKDLMKKDNDEVLGGKFAFTARSACQPGGVTGFDVLLGGALSILQSPREVTMIFSGNNEQRHIVLDRPHSANPQSSWYGESIGHYEGDTLVVDTIGLNNKTFLDNYRTPHTEKLHVVERYRLTNDGQVLEAQIRVEDPDTFNQPWSGIQRYRKVKGPMEEQVCAESITDTTLFDVSIPQAKQPDF